MTNKKSTEKKSPKLNPKLNAQGLVMCEIPKDNVKAIYDWLNSNEMLMPQNQVRQCIALLNTATIIEK